MKKYLCWYAYKGMETEGNLVFNEPECFEANSKAEALYKYQVFLSLRENRQPYYKTLTDYLKGDFTEGGWGFRVKQLDSSENIPEQGWFEGKYKEFGYDL